MDNALNYSQLEPVLTTGELAEGSECYMQGCFYAADYTTYIVVDGDNCTVINACEK